MRPCVCGAFVGERRIVCALLPAPEFGGSNRLLRASRASRRARRYDDPILVYALPSVEWPPTSRSQPSIQFARLELEGTTRQGPEKAGGGESRWDRMVEASGG